jgi:hypothetical protein
VDECFGELEVAPALLAGAPLPGIGMAWTLEEVSVPQQIDALRAMRALAMAAGRGDAAGGFLTPTRLARFR